MEHINCDLCGAADNYEVIWDKTERAKAGILRSVVIRDEAGNIIQGRNVMCKQCGLVFITPRLTKDSLDRFYAEDYRKIYGGGASLESEKRHAKTAFEILKSTLPLEPRKAKALDIGCSTGQLPDLLFWHGFAKPYGIEPNKEYFDIAKANQRISDNIENTTIEDYSPGFRFNIITMLNTLEHVTSPTAVLSKIHSLLNEGGYVLISVPNLLSTSINIPVDAFLSNVHLYNFTPATLCIMAQKCGLRPVGVYLLPEEMGEKIYMLAQKDESVEVEFDDNIEKRIEFTKVFLEHVDKVFILRQVLNSGIK